MGRRKPSERDQAISKRIRARRIELGLSLMAVAAQLGISYQAVQKIETGSTRASTHRLDQLVKVLDAPLSYFLGTAEALDSITDSSSPMIHEAITFYREMMRIKDPALRRHILSLVSMLADDQDDELSRCL